MSSLSLVILKDGTEIQRADLMTKTMNLKAATKENRVALYDLVQKCKDPNYQFVVTPSGDSRTILKKYALIEGNEGSERVHNVVKSVVLNSVEGDGFEMKLVNPLQTVKSRIEYTNHGAKL